VTAGQTFTVTLRVKGAGDLQGLSTQLGWNKSVATPVSVAAAPFAAAQGAVVFSAQAGDVDAAVLGTDRAFAGEGDLATVTFRAVQTGNPQVTIASVDARDTQNHKIQLGSSPAGQLAAVTAFAPAKPNPFNHATTLAFTLAKSGVVELAVYSVDGRKVTTLIHESRSAGSYQMTWNGRSRDGQTMKPGLYFAKLVTPEGNFSRTLVLQ